MRLLGLGLMLALGLGAGAAAAADTTLTFRFNDPEAPQMQQALDVFEKDNPGIKVEMQRVTWGDAREQFVREAATGAGPDVLQLAFVWPRSLGAAGALLPLDDLIKKTGIGVGGWDEFVSTNLAYGPDGKIYGIPFTTDTFALVYNKELLKEAGISEMPKTWPDLRKVSKTIFEKTGKAGFGFPAGSCGTPTIWFLLNFYWWSHGWAIIDQKPDGTYFMNITPAQIAEGFDYYNQFLKDGDNPKANLSICLWGAPEIVEGMVNGSIAIASVPDTVATQIVKTWDARQPGEDLALRRRSPSGGRQRLEDLLRWAHDRHQRQHDPGRCGLEAGPVPGPARSAVHEVLYELRAGAAACDELQAAAPGDPGRLRRPDQDGA